MLNRIPDPIISGLKLFNPNAKVCYQKPDGCFGVAMSAKQGGGYHWIRSHPVRGYEDVGPSASIKGTSKMALL